MRSAMKCMLEELILRGSKLQKLYLDSTSTMVNNLDCSISELLELPIFTASGLVSLS